MTPVSSLDFNLFSESTLDLVPIHHEIESRILYDQQIKLDQFHTFKCPIDKLANSHFYKIELNKECDFDPQICDPVQIPESILTPVSLPHFNPFPESTVDPVPIQPKIKSPIFYDQ